MTSLRFRSAPLPIPFRWAVPVGLLLIGIAGPLHAQQDTALGIADTIIVAGNEKTKDYVILDEMTIKPGSVVTREKIEFDRRRIYSLGLFTRVDILYDSLGTTRFLFVDVRERWYLIPTPILGFRDGDPNKVFFGGGLLHYNFRGKNQKLYGSIIFGYDPALAFSFSDPLIDRDNNLFFATSLSTSKVRNRSVEEAALTGDYDERHYDINATLGKRLSLFENAGINLGIHDVSVSSYREGRTASASGEDLYMYGTANYVYDSRDLREYATSGSMVSLFYTKNGFGVGPVNYSRFGADLRTYVPFTHDLSFATRVHGSFVSGGIVPTYAHSYFGANERIRGYYKTVIEGEDLAGGTVELRYALLEARTFVFSLLPIPAEFAVWRIGVSLALFADAGNAWYRHEKISLSSFSSGYGGGLHFLLPYGLVMRTEYAWNDHGKGQFILDLRGSI